MTSVEGDWQKAWRRTLSHFWITNQKTLCGKSHLVKQTRNSWHTPARSKCTRCLKKYNQLLKKQEKEQST